MLNGWELEGWDNFLSELDRLKEAQFPSSADEILELHKLRTAGCDRVAVPLNLVGAMVAEFLARGREGGYVQAVQTVVRAGRFQHQLACQGGVLPDTRIQLMTDDTRGRLRQSGIRSIDKSEPEPMYSTMLTLADLSTDTYLLHLSENLDEVYRVICDKYDELWREALNSGNLDEQLRCILFLQFWIVPVLHPLFGGHRRAMEAKLVLDLNRLGFNVTEVPELPEIHEAFAQNCVKQYGELFQIAFMEHFQIPKLRQRVILTKIMEKEWYFEYMGKMERAIREGAQWGTSMPEDNRLRMCMDNALMILKAYLDKEGYIQEDIYDNLHLEQED